MQTKIILIGGFLGSGKTTTILALARHWVGEGKRVAVIANDQADGLVDTDLFNAVGLDAREVAGGCFCCRFEDLVDRVDALTAVGQQDIILAEPVGSCTDLVATVINPLRALHGSRFTVAPLAVVLDPIRALRLLAGGAGRTLSEKITYIFRMQQCEASCIAINKVDLLSEAQREEVEGVTRRHFPRAHVLGFSARTGQGLDELIEWFQNSSAIAAISPDVDYDIYAAGEAALGWLNTAITLQGDRAIDFDDAAVDLARRIQRAVVGNSLVIAHGKFLLSVDGRCAAASIVSNESEPVLSHSAMHRATTFDLKVNLRVEAPPAALHDVLLECVTDWTDAHGLQIAGGEGQCFSPPRPVPTHRLREQ